MMKISARNILKGKIVTIKKVRQQPMSRSTLVAQW